MKAHRSKQNLRRRRFARVAARLSGAVVTGLLAAGDVVAQEAGQAGRELGAGAMADIGARVRLSTADSVEPLVGWIDTREPGTVRLVRESDHSVVAVPAEAIRRIELSRVRRSLGRRMTPGFIAGGLLGLVIGVATTEEKSCDPNSWFCIDFPDKALAGMFGMSVGALAGGLISIALVPGESWEDARLPTLTAGADARGGYLALRVPFAAGGP